VVAKIYTTCGGGSSIVLNSALKAEFDNMWTSSDDGNPGNFPRKAANLTFSLDLATSSSARIWTPVDLHDIDGGPAQFETVEQVPQGVPVGPRSH